MWHFAESGQAGLLDRAEISRQCVKHVLPGLARARGYRRPRRGAPARAYAARADANKVLREIKTNGEPRRA
jgi:hypothetical protein